MGLDKIDEILDKVRETHMIKPLIPLEAKPITHGATFVKIDPSSKYIVFIKRTEFFTMGEQFQRDPYNPLPAGTPIYIVDDIDNAVRIYEILDTKVTI